MARAKPTNHVAAVVSDPANPPDVVLVGGYLGASAYDGYERLYTNASLSFWVDIPGDDLLNQAPIPNDPLGAVYIWVRRHSAVVYKGQQPPGGAGASAENNDTTDNS